MYWRLLIIRQIFTRVIMLTTSTELCSTKEWKIYTSPPKLTSQNPIHTIPDCTLIQGHRSRYSRCSGHWTIIILGLVLGCWTIHVSSQIINDHNRRKILLGGVPPDPHNWCALHAYIISAYIIQALAMGSTNNCSLQVCNTTTKGTAMCTNNMRGPIGKVGIFNPH